MGVGSLAAGADSVDHQRVVHDSESVPLGNGTLALFDDLFDKLDDASAFHANQMVVVSVAVQLEHGLAAFEMMAADQTGAFELGQDPVDRRQTDLLAGLQQFLVHVLGAQMPLIAALENPEDLDPRQRHPKAGLLDLLVAHPLDASPVNLGLILR